MKNLYLFSAVAILSFAAVANAQQSITKYLTSIDGYSGNETSPKFKSIYSYNEDFTIKKRDYMEIPEGSTDLFQFLYDDYIYENQHLVNVNVYERNNTSSDYMKKKVHTFTHDVDGRIATHEIKSWDTEINDFVNNWKYSYSYSSTGLLREKHIAYANANTPNWKDILIEKYDYNSEGKYTEFRREEDPSIGNAVFEKHVFYYKSNGNLDKVDYHYKRGNSLKHERTMNVTSDSNGNITEVLVKELSQGNWKNAFKREFVYDSSTSFAEAYADPSALSYFEYISAYAQNAFLSYTGYMWTSNGWDKRLTNKYNYTKKSDMSVKDNILSNNKFSIAPNPAHDFINISFDGLYKPNDFEIYNATGQLIMKGKIINNKVGVNSLSKGVYFLKINLNGKQFTKEFIKR